jgi:hypothetical protein
MSTAWDTYHRRARALRTAVDRIEASGGVELPSGDGLDGAFADRTDLLVALHDLWTRRLDARVEVALELDERLPEESVTSAWQEVAAELPEVRRVLDRYQHDPALQRSQRHEYRLLAVAAGLATLDDPPSYRTAVGGRLLDRIRSADSDDGGRLADRMADLVRRVPMRILGARLGA